MRQKRYWALYCTFAKGETRYWPHNHDSGEHIFTGPIVFRDRATALRYHEQKIQRTPR